MNAKHTEQIIRASVHHFIGRLGRDSELRYFESGNAVANNRLLVNLPGSKKSDGLEPDAFKLEIWGTEQAQAFSDTCGKGCLVHVVGRVKEETWADRSTGEERQQPVITVDRWELLRANQQTQQQGAPVAPAQAAVPRQRGAF